ncbi:putative C6 finger domain protein Acr-2 [Aspergillus candidus]|uniref:Putative C6 finger domain protein Acr-2 n=1 Tax=Aspergillus candidus TaxID=41067 RepID=A0A2I2FCY0_ASPCN|nr:putative C6 finger domain protein Acr-2 [Aspergillus candidus]PLB38503.1 putative C6 finger domain protein Acr-2 [Aspergillus candidus]
MMGLSFDQNMKDSTDSEGKDSSMVGPSHDSQRDNQTETMPPQRSTTLMAYNSPPRILVDPLFQDLNPLMRFYVVHFNQNVANNLTLYTDVQNPFLELTPLIGGSPGLTYALTATGALHYAIMAHDDGSLMPWSADGTNLTGSWLSVQEVEDAAMSSMARRPSSKAYEQFLGLKQRALQQLSRDIEDPVLRNDTRTLITIVVFALMDAIESGGGAWKYHLEGAKRLLQTRQQDNNRNQAQGIIEWLDTSAIDGCLIIQLMGSTLARPGSLSKPFYSTTDMSAAVLKRLEETTWVGCPAYLLEVIFIVHAWCSEPNAGPTSRPKMIFPSAFLAKNADPLESPRAFLHHIQAFDPAAWAETMQSYVFLPDLTMRLALATIYRASVYLYASRVLCRSRDGPMLSLASGLGIPSDHSDVANLLIRQITLIPVADPHFKCLIWPTFIAGAECRDPSLRPFLMEKLSALYYDITSINVRNAAWVLSLMWRKRDQKRMEKASRRWEFPSSQLTHDMNDDNDDDDDFDWIQELDESRIDWLFI